MIMLDEIYGLKLE